MRWLFIFILMFSGCSFEVRQGYELQYSLFKNNLNKQKMKQVKILDIKKAKGEHYQDITYTFRVKCPSCRALNKSPKENLTDMVNIYQSVSNDANIIPIVDSIEILQIYYSHVENRYEIVSRAMLYKGVYTCFTFVYTSEILK